MLLLEAQMAGAQFGCVPARRWVQISSAVGGAMPVSSPARSLIFLFHGVCLLVAALVVLALPTGGPSAPTPVTASQEPNPFARINHVVVIYQENWSFDSLYGHFPGANGLEQAQNAPPQVDKVGVPYASLPQPLNSHENPAVPDDRFPTDLPNAPFDLSAYVAPDELTGDTGFHVYQEQYQINGGRMDQFVAYGDSGGLVMSYYDATPFPEGQLAQQYTIADNFFHAAFGGSFLNAMWLACACTPVWPDAPDSVVAKLDENGSPLISDAKVTPDGFVVGTAYTVNSPHPPTVTDPSLLLPNQTFPTIGDRLTDRGISWAWYAGGWNDALAGHPDPLFQFHHHPFAYFANFADGTAGKAEHLKDEANFFDDLASGKLPAVSFVKPIGEDNEHPGYASLARGQQHVADVVEAIRRSPVWNDTAIVITYDENGGRWDHVAPPAGDRWGPGTRVPMIVISTLAKRAYVDHTEYDTTSIPRTIEVRWGLDPLGSRDARANDLRNAFDSLAAADGGAGVVTPSLRYEATREEVMREHGPARTKQDGQKMAIRDHAQSSLRQRRQRH